MRHLEFDFSYDDNTVMNFRDNKQKYSDLNNGLGEVWPSTSGKYSILLYDSVEFTMPKHDVLFVPLEEN